jgi:hypothetical protein
MQPFPFRALIYMEMGDPRSGRMRNLCKLAVTAMLIAALGTVPVAANPGRENGKWAQGRHDPDRGDGRARGALIAGCPPGLAKKNPPCVPPGQARNQGVRYGNQVGDVLRVGDYIVIRDPRRYDLEQRAGWNYYRDGHRILRVDSGTRRVLAVLELIEAFSN